MMDKNKKIRWLKRFLARFLNMAFIESNPDGSLFDKDNPAFPTFFYCIACGGYKRGTTVDPVSKSEHIECPDCKSQYLSSSFLTVILKSKKEFPNDRGGQSFDDFVVSIIIGMSIDCYNRRKQ